MQARNLPGHYGRQVEVDTCSHCCLIWFDETESVRLAGPGVAELVRVIHAAMSGGDIHPHAASLARLQQCPVCGAQLKPVTTSSRFGRTTQLQCPQRHGYYQTYILYLAEKGFVRPLAWADIAQLTAHGKELFCASCGASMPARPHDACPYCHSALGILDPARLASAIDPHDLARLVADADSGPDGPAHAAAPGGPPALAREQAHCHACGGPVDLTRDIHCPSCRAAVRRDTSAAAAAAASVEAAVRANHQRQHPSVSRAKLRAETAAEQARAIDERPMRRWGAMKLKSIAGIVVSAGLLAGWFYYKPAPRGELTEEQLMARAPKEAPLLSYNSVFDKGKIRCDPVASARKEVRVRELLIAPLYDEAREPLATLGAMRAAYARASQARKEWLAGASHDVLQERYAGPAVLEHGTASGFFPRGARSPQVENAAFCLPMLEISPVILAADGFHLIQVIEAR